LKIASLEKKYNNHYDRSVLFTAGEARSDLHWWVVNATNENGVFLQKLHDIVSIQGVPKKTKTIEITKNNLIVRI
jgi:hypothetical protein